MIKMVIDKLLEYMSWKILVACLFVSVITFAIVYVYIGPFEDDKMVIGGVALCYAFYCSIGAMWTQYNKSRSGKPKPKKRNR